MTKNSKCCVYSYFYLPITTLCLVFAVKEEVYRNFYLKPINDVPIYIQEAISHSYWEPLTSCTYIVQWIYLQSTYSHLLRRLLQFICNSHKKQILFFLNCSSCKLVHNQYINEQNILILIHFNIKSLANFTSTMEVWVVKVW